MGGAVSSGRDNNELIDNLMSGSYIRTPGVERVFRLLDRADYMTRCSRDQAYKDLAWRSGSLHLSAPCIYSEVMEGLELKPGLSFLNIGSGTGYLSTLAGLMIGSSGISHGVEIMPSVVDYSNKRLGQFMGNSCTLDELDFCEPRFYCGNGLRLAPLPVGYDRVYVGAGCPEQYQNYFKQLIKVGGILVMPLNDSLVQIRRVSADEWSSRNLLNVSFATLRVPSANDSGELLRLEEQTPVRLMSLCRRTIREAMRGAMRRRHPELREPPPRAPPAKRQCPRRICIPISDDDGEDMEGLNALHDLERLDRAGGAAEMNALLSLVLSMGTNRAAGALRVDPLDTDSDDGDGDTDDDEDGEASAQRSNRSNSSAVSDREDAENEPQAGRAINRGRSVIVFSFQGRSDRDHSDNNPNSDREQAISDREQGTSDRDQANSDREQATSDRDQANSHREQGTGDRDQENSDREQANSHRKQAVGTHSDSNHNEDNRDLNNGNSDGDQTVNKGEDREKADNSHSERKNAAKDHNDRDNSGTDHAVNGPRNRDRKEDRDRTVNGRRSRDRRDRDKSDDNHGKHDRNDDRERSPTRPDQNNPTNSKHAQEKQEKCTTSNISDREYRERSPTRRDQNNPITFQDKQEKCTTSNIADREYRERSPTRRDQNNPTNSKHAQEKQTCTTSNIAQDVKEKEPVASTSSHVEDNDKPTPDSKKGSKETSSRGLNNKTDSKSPNRKDRRDSSGSNDKWYPTVPAEVEIYVSKSQRWSSADMEWEDPEEVEPEEHQDPEEVEHQPPADDGDEEKQHSSDEEPSRKSQRCTRDSGLGEDRTPSVSASATSSASASATSSASASASTGSCSPPSDGSSERHNLAARSAPMSRRRRAKRRRQHKRSRSSTPEETRRGDGARRVRLSTVMKRGIKELPLPYELKSTAWTERDGARK